MNIKICDMCGSRSVVNFSCAVCMAHYDVCEKCHQKVLAQFHIWFAEQRKTNLAELAKLNSSEIRDGICHKKMKERWNKKVEASILAENNASEHATIEPCSKCGGTVGHKVNCPVGIAFGDAPRPVGAAASEVTK